MSSRFHKSLAALIPACAALAAPAAAAATTKTVYAGPPQSSVKAIARSLGLTKSFENRYNPEVNAFFTTRVTINASDTVSFVNTGFHTIDIPAKGGGDLPFVLP